MTSVYRTTAIWQGFAGAPGYTRFSWQDLTTDTARNAAGAAMRQFFFTLSAYLLNTWTVQVQSEIQEFDMASGALVGSANMTTVPAIVTGATAAVPYAGGSGIHVVWNTALIFNRRRVRGGTYLVPFVSCFQSDGTLTSVAISDVQSAANALITPSSPEFAVWAKTFSKTKPPVQTGGAIAPVTGATVKDMASQLRSRRT